MPPAEIPASLQSVQIGSARAGSASGGSGALISERLAAEPLLLTHAAEALRSGSVTLSEEDADEFRELGGSVRLAELANGSWDDLDPEDQRLVVLALLESIMVDPEGDTVADRLEIVWRF